MVDRKCLFMVFGITLRVLTTTTLRSIRTVRFVLGGKLGATGEKYLYGESAPLSQRAYKYKHLVI